MNASRARKAWVCRFVDVPIQHSYVCLYIYICLMGSNVTKQESLYGPSVYHYIPSYGGYMDPQGP